MDLTVPTFIVIISLIIIVVISVYVDKNRLITISQLKRISKSYQDDADREFKEKLSNNVKYEKRIKELNDLYERAYYINKFWDIILREIFNRYGYTARLGEITYGGLNSTTGVYKFGVNVNIPSKRNIEGNCYSDDITHIQEYIELLIPDKETDIQKKYGKQLNDLQIKF